MTSEKTAKTAAITGAAGGLGTCFAGRLAEQGYNLLLVDRRAEPVEQLAAELAAKHGIAAQALEADLTAGEAVEALAQKLAETPTLELLVNNAGFGLARYFFDDDVDRHLDMIRVHVLAAVRLTHAVLPGMMQRNRGTIVNVSSLCAWTPCAGMVSYAATKSYLTIFSQALQDELRDTNICIQALCPGFVRTEFHAAEGMKSFDPKQVPKRLWLGPDQVVDCSLKNLTSKRVIVIPGWRNRVLGRFMQMPLLQPLVRAISRQKRTQDANGP